MKGTFPSSPNGNGMTGQLSTSGHLLVNWSVNEYYWRRVKFSAKLSHEVPCTRERHAACIHDDFVYIMGGNCGSICLKDIWRYHLRHHYWERVVSRGDALPHLHGHTLVPYKCLIYIFGGDFNQDTTETPLWIYNPDLSYIRKLWVEPGHSYPSPRRGHSATIYRGIMYLYGGYVDVSGSSAELWAFDTDMEEWEYIAQEQTTKRTPGSRHGHSAVTHGGHMWVLGGMSGLAPRGDMWRWSYRDRQWTLVKSRHCPVLSGHSATVVGDSMFVFGGEAPDRDPQDTLWRFHFKSSRWERIFTNVGVIPPRAFHATLAKLPTLEVSEREATSRSHSYPILRKDKVINRPTLSAAAPSGTFQNRVSPQASTDPQNKYQESEDASKSAIRMEFARNINDKELDSDVDQMIEMADICCDKLYLADVDVLDICHQQFTHFDLVNSSVVSDEFDGSADDASNVVLRRKVGVFATSSCSGSNLVEENAGDFSKPPFKLSPRSESSLPKRRSVHAADVVVEDLESGGKSKPDVGTGNEVIRGDNGVGEQEASRYMKEVDQSETAAMDVALSGVGIEMVTVNGSCSKYSDCDTVEPSSSAFRSITESNFTMTLPGILPNQQSSKTDEKLTSSMSEQFSPRSTSDVISLMSDVSLEMYETSFSEATCCLDNDRVTLKKLEVERVPSQTKSMVERCKVTKTDDECALIILGGRDETQKMFPHEGLPMWKCCIPYTRE